MAGAQGIALEWALALLRAPGERHALRQRPLPEGIKALLAIAGGASPEALAEAAARLREPPDVLREAARFYVREVLFHPQADAYRVLGVGPDASAATIKAHHRLLQHWLHPDRLQSQDDSVFAGRVNTAWNHLRSETRRRDYDQGQSSLVTLDHGELPSGLRPTTTWAPVGVPPRSPHRMPVYALLAACLVLGGLVARDAVREPDAAWGQLPQAPAMADAIPPIQVPEPIDKAALAPRKRSKPTATAVRRPPAALAPGPPRRAQAPEDGRRSAPNVATMPESAPQIPSTHARMAEDRADAPVASLQKRAPPAAAVAAVPPAVTVRRVARSDVAVAAAMPVAAAPTTGRSAAVLANADAKAVAADPGFARIQMARQTGGQLLRYMGAADRRPPPIWNSPGILSSAELLRTDLHQHGRVRLGAPEWRIGAGTASLSAAVARPGATAPGRLSADLVWREGQWMVTGIGVEQGR